MPAFVRLALAVLLATGLSVTSVSREADAGGQQRNVRTARVKPGTTLSRAGRRGTRQKVRTAAFAPRPSKPKSYIRPRRIVRPGDNPIDSLPRARSRRSRIVFGVMGGAGEETPPEIDARMEVIGARIAQRGHVTLTGACPGLPESAARGARAEGGLTVGISSYRSLKDHVDSGSPTDFDVLQLTELPLAHRGQVRPNYMGREIDNIERSDVIIVAGGRFGTLGELAIALEEQRPIGVLTGTGGIADIVREIVAASTKAGKPPGAPVIYDSNPARLVSRLEQAHRQMEKKGVRAGPLGDGFRVRK